MLVFDLLFFTLSERDEKILTKIVPNEERSNAQRHDKRPSFPIAADKFSSAHALLWFVALHGQLAYLPVAGGTCLPRDGPVTRGYTSSLTDSISCR